MIKIDVSDGNGSYMSLYHPGKSRNDIKINDICWDAYCEEYIITAYRDSPYRGIHDIVAHNRLEYLKEFQFIKMDGFQRIKDIEDDLLKAGLKIVLAEGK